MLARNTPTPERFAPDWTNVCPAHPAPMLLNPPGSTTGWFWSITCCAASGAAAMEAAANNVSAEYRVRMCASRGEWAGEREQRSSAREERRERRIPLTDPNGLSPPD